MADIGSSEYYRFRELRERDLARTATDPLIAAIHLDMAQRYSDRALALAATGLRHDLN